GFLPAVHVEAECDVVADPGLVPHRPEHGRSHQQVPREDWELGVHHKIPLIVRQLCWPSSGHVREPAKYADLSAEDLGVEGESFLGLTLEVQVGADSRHRGLLGTVAHSAASSSSSTGTDAR